MTETLLFLGIGSILVVGVATLVTAVLTLRSARRYVDLAEERMERLREGQDRLLLLLREERQRPKEESLPPETKQPAEEERERTIHAHQDGQPIRNAQRESRPAPFEEPSESAPVRHALATGEMAPPEPPETEKAPSNYSNAASEPGKEPRKVSTEPGKSPLAVWHPHPDDDVTPRGTLPGPAPRRSDAPMKMFRTLYDRYLDNYEGYVKLAERLYLSRDNDEAPAGSPAEREWEERLRRAYDGIERTVARLDILEESNPELATDDRVYQRTSIAQSHSNLTSHRPQGVVADKERADIFTGS